MVLEQRIVVVSPDASFGAPLVSELTAHGNVVVTATPTPAMLEDALLVLHLDGELATTGPALIGALTGRARAIAVLPRSNLAQVVDVMRASERVAGVVVAEDLDAAQLAAMAGRIIAGERFGIEQLGVELHRDVVTDYQEKLRCIDQVAGFAERMGVRRKYRQAIEHCLDEMLMNALYDAPGNEQHRQPAIVQYACDGKRFVVAVRDPFGTLERDTVLKYLHKCLHQREQIDRKVGGAGLGLYLMASSASQVYFNVQRGVMTEAACTFDLATPLRLGSFGFFTAGRRAPSTQPATPRSRGVVVGLSVAIATTVALIVAVLAAR